MAETIERTFISTDKINAFNWNNYDNAEFYEKVTPEALEKIAFERGLSNGCDIKALKAFWENANHILDAGGGYGRVIDALFQNGFNKSVTAIERSAIFYRHLDEKYQGNQQVKLVKTDLHDLSILNEKFDVIFFLWGSLGDFSKIEQPRIIQGLAEKLQPEGKLIIDLAATETNPKELKTREDGIVYLDTEFSPVYHYQPSEEEIALYAKKAFLKIYTTLKIKTENNNYRRIYVLST